MGFALGFSPIMYKPHQPLCGASINTHKNQYKSKD